MMKVIFAICVLTLAGFCVLVWAEPPDMEGSLLSEDAPFTEYDKNHWPPGWFMYAFSPVNPSYVTDCEEYIWCAPSAVRVGSAITLWIEYVAKREHFFSALPFPEEPDSALLIKRKISNWVVCLRWPQIPRSEWKRWIPPAERVPYWRLHGQRLVFPDKEGWVYMQRGDSFVTRIPDITSLFVKKRDREGRVWIRCFRFLRFRDKEKYEKSWLPIEGRYKVQWGCSNIIEFEIRQ